MNKEIKAIIKKARDLHKDVDIEALLDKVCKENHICLICRNKKLKNNQEFCKNCRSDIKSISKDYIEEQEDA